MSDSDIGKKEEEREYLYPFLEEYRLVTGRELTVLECRERPDFIVGNDKEERFGLEITRIMVDPETRKWREILDKDEFMDPQDTTIHLLEQLYRKSEKIKSSGWELPDFTILVLAVMDAPIEDMTPFLDEEILDELSMTKFLEIWAADFTIMGAYNTVQLMGLKAGEYTGLHKPHPISWKPYG